MRLLAPAVLIPFSILFSVCVGPACDAASLLEDQQQETSQATTAKTSTSPATIQIPAGTKVTLALTSPIWAKTAKAGDSVYAVTVFPVAGNNTMLIPAATYVLGEIDAITKPTWKNARALFQMHFNKIIFANGYTLELKSAPAQAATATLHVDVTSRNDVLLDNGAQFDMIVQTPLALDANRVAEAVRRTRPMPVGSAKSASLCRPIPATPGTSDTVIPGTPGTPGTPDITIPGPDGTSTTIPGSPATPGTPDTVIPGTPGTPAIPCPAPGAVVSGLGGPQIHTQTFQVTSELTVSGKKLSPGSYQVMWLGTQPAVQVDLLQNGKTIVRTAAHITTLPESSASDKTVTRANPDGSLAIASLEFTGESFAVIFD